jgi:hypothetical protein
MMEEAAIAAWEALSERLTVEWMPAAIVRLEALVDLLSPVLDTDQLVLAVLARHQFTAIMPLEASRR